MANQMIAYAKRFPKPIIAMEKLSGMRNGFKKSKKFNRRFHTLPFRKLQTIIEYKALHHRIEVKHLTRKETKSTSKTCHGCRHVARKVNGRMFKCPRCGLTYDGDLNGAINIARALTRRVGWRSRGSREPACEAGRNAVKAG